MGKTFFILKQGPDCLGLISPMVLCEISSWDIIGPRSAISICYWHPSEGLHILGRHWPWQFIPLASGRFWYNFRRVIFKLIWVSGGWGIYLLWNYPQGILEKIDHLITALHCILHCSMCYCISVVNVSKNSWCSILRIHCVHLFCDNVIKQSISCGFPANKLWKKSL